MRLAGKVSIITGAASGMGQAAAVIFAKEGSMVVAADINEEGLKRTEAQVRDAGGQVVVSRTDVSSSGDVQALVRLAVEAFGGIHVLYNNAGLRHPNDVFATELDEEIWDRVIDTNLKGMFLTCKYAIPVMLQGGGGSIVNTSSIGGLKAADSTAYGASKGGVIALTRNIAKQYAPAIRANSICPGPVDTPMLAVALESIRGARPEIATAAAKAGTMLQRWADPSEIGNLALFLASDDSSFITAANFSIDGGMASQ